MFNWSQHIKQLSPLQAQKARNMVLLAIVCIMAAQGLVIHLLAFSFSSEQEFSVGVQRTEQVLTSTHQAWKDKVKIILDFNTSHNPEKQPIRSSLATVFNLFYESIGIELPHCPCVWVSILHQFFYQNLYYHLISPSIAHPPQTV